jgi:uncharacterized protein
LEPNESKKGRGVSSRRVTWIAVAVIVAGIAIGAWNVFFESKKSAVSDQRSIGEDLLSKMRALVDPPRNRLAGAASPYLHDAARQPVHWYPWGEQAFRRARDEGKPILLDIGAVWCHWCHVMDEESYENKEIAALINRYFIAVKVDMDERPDIDSRYQQAVQAISGSGGWPLTAFLTSDGNVFYGGTYFPPEDRAGRPGLKTILPKIGDLYQTRKEEMEAGAKQIATAVGQFTSESIREGALSKKLVNDLFAEIVKRFDPVHGGFGDGVKFPSSGAIELSLALHFDDGTKKALDLVTKTLDGMARGGIYDQIGGGFFRYSTDPGWRVPHFEKMNYDNAALLINYLHAYQATGKPLYREVAEGIMKYLSGVLSDPKNGGFYAHQDADMSRNDDGGYYTWTVEEIQDALSEDEAEVLLRYYDVRPEGEMREHPNKNVLYIAATPESIGKELGIPVEKVWLLIDQGRRTLLDVRAIRRTPFVDRTLYMDRNGMLISAYLEASIILGDDQARTLALKTLDRIVRDGYRAGEGMGHAFFEKGGRTPGLLNDQIQTANALLDGFAVTGDKKYMKLAVKLADYAVDRFWDSDSGGFFDRPAQDNHLGALERPHKDYQDDPIMAPNAVAARVFDRLASLTNDLRYAKRAEQTLRAFAGSATGHGSFAATYGLAVHYHVSGIVQAVVIGGKDDPNTQVLWKSVLAAYRPGKVVSVYDPTKLDVSDLPPAVAGAVKAFGSHGEARAYICAGASCGPPTKDPAEAIQLVKTYGLKRS